MKSKIFNKNFSLNTQLQRRIAHGYYVDGRDWMMLLKAIDNIDFDPDSYLAKKFAIMIFSYECSMKSIFVSLNSKRRRAIDIYDEKVMRSHNINEIYQECKTLSRSRYKIIKKSFESTLPLIDSLGMNLRYSNDYLNIMKNEPMIERVFRESPSFLVTKEEFVNSCHSECIHLIKNAGNIYSKRFRGHEAIKGSNVGIIDECMSYIMTRPKQRKNLTKPSDKL